MAQTNHNRFQQLYWGGTTEQQSAYTTKKMFLTPDFLLPIPEVTTVNFLGFGLKVFYEATSISVCLYIPFYIDLFLKILYYSIAYIFLLTMYLRHLFTSAHIVLYLIFVMLEQCYSKIWCVYQC